MLTKSLINTSIGELLKPSRIKSALLKKGKENKEAEPANHLPSVDSDKIQSVDSDSLM